MPRLQTQPNLSPTTIFNPSLEVFTFEYDGEKYVLAPYDVVPFPKYLADKMASRLADEIIARRGVMKNHELDKQELLKEIYV